ncbi:GAF domain-containing protein [Chroococcus sp. FPU101]|uniref:GAF domain-containing protein n=1 Tax=Chroococcus sp. FPU101 TaxID=1974212 RepID=UPI001A8EC90E|nr:GAF domain-containing protein [Chroococcus sp. FPU101]GFE70371.1 sensory transduction histidine kinase [Chroococcus sp. FPU101]
MSEDKTVDQRLIKQNLLLTLLTKATELFELDKITDILDQQAELLTQSEQREEKLQAALSQELAKRTNDSEKEAERERSISLVIDKIRQTLDINTIFQTAATEVQKLLGVEHIAIYQFREDYGGDFIFESEPQKPFPHLVGKSWNDEHLMETKGGRLRENQPCVANDVEQDERFIQCYHSTISVFQLRSFAVVPLFLGETLWGLLAGFQHSSPKHWQADEIKLLQKVGIQLGVALQQTEYLKRIQQQFVQERALSQVIDKIRRTLDLDTIFQTTVTEVRQLLEADRVAIYQFIPDTNWVEGEFISEAVLAPFDSALAARVADHCFGDNYATSYQQGRIWSLNNLETAHLSECHTAILSRFQVKANLVAPLLSGENLWGLLCIHQCSSPRHWQETEIEFVSKIATNLGVALQQAELLAQTQARSQELQTALAQVEAQKEQQKALTQVIDKIRRTLDLDTIFQTTATEVRQLLQVDRVAIFCFEHHSKWTEGEFVAEDVNSSFGSALAAKIVDRCFGEKHATYYQQNRLWAVNDISQANLIECHLNTLNRFQVKANLVAPLLIGKNLWGLLCIHQCSSPRHWQESEIEFVSKIATNLGVALQQAELLAQTQKRTKELQTALAQVEAQKEHLAHVAAQERALARVIKRIRQTLDVEDIFRATTEEVRHILNCDRVVVYRFYDDWSGEFLYESMSEIWRPLIWSPGLKTVWEDTYLQATKGGRYRYHETFAVDDIYQAGLTQCHVEILEHFQVKAFAIVPVFVGEKLWGLLGAYQNTATRQWKQREIALLDQIANQLGVGVYQAQLLIRTKQQSRELETTLADLNAIVDNLADGLLVIDILGRITRFNPTLISMFRLEQVNLTGKHIATVFDEKLVKLIEQSERCQQQIVTAAVDLEQGREGQALATSIIKESYGEEGTQCLGSVILIRDVTVEREIDRMKTEFLANVSHELRTPLTSVLGFASLIKEKLKDVIIPSIALENIKVHQALHKVETNIEIIVSEAERLTDLINDVLDIAKMEAGQLEWVIQPTSPREMIQRAIATTEPLFQNKQITLIQDIELELPVIWVDENRFIQVLLNLISNAVKFAEEGIVTCRAKIVQEQLLISISDTGIGIPDEYKDMIFDRFKQGGDVLTDKPKGTGLGLPICKQIIEHHGGKIWVESLLGQGSTFFIAMPISPQVINIHEEMKTVSHLFEES